jgi:hypothetical protein
MMLGVVAGCDDDDSEVSRSVAGEAVVTGDWAGQADAELDVVSGADTVVVRAADVGDHLFRASTPTDARGTPVATVDRDVVRVSLAASGGHGGANLVIELNPTVRWRIRLDGGASQETVTMDAGLLTALDFGAGSTRIEATLPIPQGTVPVRMTGGASAFTLRLPPGVTAQVRMAGGAGRANIDGTVHTGIPGGTEFTPNDWPTATNRYLIDNTAGVSALTLNRTTT